MNESRKKKKDKGKDKKEVVTLQLKVIQRKINY